MEVLSKFRYLYINNPSIPEVLRDLKQENPYNKQTRPGICNMMDHPSNFERIQLDQDFFRTWPDKVQHV